MEGNGRRVCSAPVNRAVKSMKPAWVYDIQQVSYDTQTPREAKVDGGGCCLNRNQLTPYRDTDRSEHPT